MIGDNNNPANKTEIMITSREKSRVSPSLAGCQKVLPVAPGTLACRRSRPGRPRRRRSRSLALPGPRVGIHWQVLSSLAGQLPVGDAMRVGLGCPATRRPGPPARAAIIMIMSHDLSSEPGARPRPPVPVLRLAELLSNYSFFAPGGLTTRWAGGGRRRPSVTVPAIQAASECGNRRRISKSIRVTA